MSERYVDDAILAYRLIRPDSHHWTLVGKILAKHRARLTSVVVKHDNWLHPHQLTLTFPRGRVLRLMLSPEPFMVGEIVKYRNRML